jgi:hypothetical protein
VIITFDGSLTSSSFRYKLLVVTVLPTCKPSDHFVNFTISFSQKTVEDKEDQSTMLFCSFVKRAEYRTMNSERNLHHSDHLAPT